MTYIVVIPDNSRVFDSGQCNHKHKTYAAARRCLNKLSVYYKDGGHNEWAHYGTVWQYDDDGVGQIVDWETEIEYIEKGSK